MSAIPSLSLQTSSSAKAYDQGSENLQNTPVSVIAGNSGADPVALINAASNLQRQQSEPVEAAISGATPFNSNAGGGFPQWIWLAALGLLAVVLLRRK